MDAAVPVVLVLWGKVATTRVSAFYPASVNRNVSVKHVGRIIAVPFVGSVLLAPTAVFRVYASSVEVARPIARGKPVGETAVAVRVVNALPV